MTQSNLLVIAALLIAVAVYAYIYFGAKRLYAEREKRVRDQAASEPAPPPATAPPPAQAPAPAPAAPDGPADDLTQIKGIGPKLSARLAELGIVQLRQIAEWTPAELAAIDAQLGTFQGRPERDQWQSQARLLLGGDRKAYERAHGKLGGNSPPAGPA